MMKSVSIMKKEKNEIIPISPVIDITQKDKFNLEIKGTYTPITIIDDTKMRDKSINIKIEESPENPYDLIISGTVYLSKNFSDNMIPIVKFKKEYYDKIVTGKKTQTLRMARKKLDVHEGETIKAIFPGTTKEALLHITKIGYKQFKSVDQEDAEREGYETLKELREDLKKIYPLLEQFDRLYYYQFELISEVET